MRFRRGFRRKPRVQWLPMPGTQLKQNDAGVVLPVGENPSAIEFSFETLDSGATTVSAPLVVDNPVSETVQGTTIPTWQNFALNQTNEFGWRLRRIVGDIFIAVLAVNDQQSAPAGVLCEAGIIVRRVNHDGQPAVTAQDQDVGTISNESDPWVWRRNWALSNQTAVAAGNPLGAINQLPNTNTKYGTKHHVAIDQKTARRLGPEERLFLTFTAWELPLNQTDVPTGNTNSHLIVYVLMPYRVLGTVITSAGNRRNASR